MIVNDIAKRLMDQITIDLSCPESLRTLCASKPSQIETQEWSMYTTAIGEWLSELYRVPMTEEVMSQIQTAIAMLIEIK